MCGLHILAAVVQLLKFLKIRQQFLLELKVYLVEINLSYGGNVNRLNG